MLKTYRLYHYEVWGNAEDGFDVNDVMRTAFTFDVEEGQDPVERMVEEGLADKGRVEVDRNIDREGTIYLLSAEHGNPVAELREEA